MIKSTLLSMLAASVAAAAETPPPKGGSVEEQVLQAMDPDDRGGCFEYATADLDGDGIPESVTLSRDPVWCGTGGCTATVYARGARGLEEMSSIALVGELLLARSRTRGWRDLVVLNRDGTWLLAFDGERYPENPSVTPARRLAARPPSDTLTWSRAKRCPKQ
jgi:hypothetical protein